MGRPQSGWRILGVRERMRVPSPAARTTAAVRLDGSVRDAVTRAFSGGVPSPSNRRTEGPQELYLGPPGVDRKLSRQQFALILDLARRSPRSRPAHRAAAPRPGRWSGPAADRARTG